MNSLNIIFPDQLSLKNEALKTSSDEDLLLFYEPHDSFYEISHHKHKLVFQISALRHLINKHDHKNIKHEKISKKPPKLIEYLRGIRKEVHFSTVNVARPSDFKTLKDLMYFCQSSNVELNLYDDKNFITSPSDYQYWAKDKKSTTQEFYYRWLRKRNSILMDDAKPIGGSWNYDKENRQGISKLKSPIPERSKITTDQITLEVMIEVEEIFVNSLGDLESFNWAVTHEDASKAFNDFLNNYLENYGTFQDAINKENAFMFHSLLSPYFNAGLLDPLNCIKIVEKKYHESNGSIPLNSVEGFIRQVLGWREFIMGVYWDNMPQYQQQNFWNHKKGLAESWYTGETGIPPLDGAIKESIDLGYTHHINRLMIISNLMNLSGVDPNIIYKWFMEMYVDSSDWVMAPNVMGMGLFSDGGIFATKPYICGSSYILKMSDYPKGEWCEVMDGLYWKFIEDHKDFFLKNYRLAMMAKLLEKMDSVRKKRIFSKADEFIHQNTN